MRRHEFYGLLAIALGDKEAAKDYSVHSFRSFLASSMLAADCSDAQIQATLRWASAEALKEYKQVNAEVYGSWILKSELVHTLGPGLTGLRTHQLPRLKPRARHASAVATGSTIGHFGLPHVGEIKCPQRLVEGSGACGGAGGAMAT